MAAKRCRHSWQHVEPVVRVIGEPMPAPEQTFNAVCTKCKTRRWLHWAPLRQAA